MSPLPYSEIVRLLDETSEEFQRRGDYTVRTIFSGPRAMTFTNPAGFVLVQVTEVDKQQSRSWIQITGGGAENLRTTPELFRRLLTRAVDFDWGSPFTRQLQNGMTTFGYRLIIPSDVITAENLGKCVGYIYGMIDTLGTTARKIALEILPEAGGRLLDGSSSSDGHSLFAAIMYGAPGMQQFIDSVKSGQS
jgi:hypothetical protein